MRVLQPLELDLKMEYSVLHLRIPQGALATGVKCTVFQIPEFMEEDRVVLVLHQDLQAEVALVVLDALDGAWGLGVFR